MSINFFLNEFFYEDINKNINSSDDNFIINGIFLTKLKKNKYNFKTIVENYTIEEKRSLKKKKKTFDDKIRQTLPKLITNKASNYLNLDSSMSFPLERIFMHHNNSNYDFNYFFSKNHKKIENMKINIYYGGDYRLTESLSLLYFLLLISNIKSQEINIYYKDRKSSLEKFSSINDFLNSKLVSNEISNINSKKIKSSNKSLLWTEGLREKDFWIKKLKPLSLGYNSLESENFINLKIKSNFFEDEIKLFNNYNINNVLDFKKLDQFDYSFEIIKNFFLDFALKIITKRLYNITTELNKIIDFNNFEFFFTPPAPLLESIAIANEMKVRKKKIYLIPHSSTPSHEFHPDCYVKQFTFISSDKIMPSSLWNLKNISKEYIISENFFTHTKIKKNNFKLFFNRLNILLNKFNFFSSYGIFFIKLSEILYDNINFYSQMYLFRYFSRKSIKIGMVLNVEIYESLLDIDYKIQNNIISKLLNICLKNNYYLLIRRKPGWTNFRLLKNLLKEKFKKKELKNIILCNDKFLINEYFKNVKVNLFFQGSTAIFDSIKNNRPCIFLQDPDLILMNEQYVNFPEKIVPKISIERIENFLKNEKFLKDLLDKQIEFINVETGNDNQRIANFNQLNL